MHDDDDLASKPQVKPLPRRVERRLAPLVGAVLLADVSESMGDQDGLDRTKPDAELRAQFVPRRIDRLAKVLDYLLKRVRVQKLLCFADLPEEISLEGRVVLPEPGGSTALHVALEHVADIVPKPSRLILLSDGMPNSVPHALAAARRLAPMVIDAYYVGPEALAPAMTFMADIAACGGPGGKHGYFDLLHPVLIGTELKNRLLRGPDRP